jgi:hypothetical protein
LYAAAVVAREVAIVTDDRDVGLVIGSLEDGVIFMSKPGTEASVLFYPDGDIAVVGRDAYLSGISEIEGEGYIFLEAAGDTVVTTEGSTSITSGSSHDITAGTSATITAAASTTITTGSTASINGTRIDLNAP